MRLALLTLLTFSLLADAAAPAVAPSREAVAFFESRVRPLLVKHCQSCHSVKKTRGGLRLDSAAALARGGESGPAIDSAHRENSLLLRAVRHEEGPKSMPPSGKLTAAEIRVLEQWVREGAVFPGPASAPPRQGIDIAAAKKFWSFQPAVTHSPPADTHPGWPLRRIDTFLLAAMRKQGLSPAPTADRLTLIRRLSFDLTGLPPTPDEITTFLADSRPDANERLVDRLLASPAHGERWGRFWLDLVRYADVAEQWAGLKGTPGLYRDWVIGAANADLPYSRFVQQQLAADLLPGSTPADRAALGFIGLSPQYWKELKLDHQVIKGVVAEEWEERIHTLSSTFLGLTTACARCHDHKFDPITMQDYYALAGVFASIRQTDVPAGVDRAGKPVLVPGVVEQSLLVVPDGPHRTKLVHEGKPQNVAMQMRGNPATPGPSVPRRFLAVLSVEEPRPFRQGSGRLELANAIIGEGSSLAARVIVNRVWKHHFGEGIVRTPSDFGSQGERPTHPELLDDLSARFIAAGWSLKWLHREIVLSAAYRQRSTLVDQDKFARDPDNRWLSRMSRRRLEVEAWRDAMLAVTGTLRAEQGGPAAELVPGNNRRTIYGLVRRRELSDLLRLHDFPDPTTHSPARVPTTTPLQQLFVLNSPFIRQQAEALAARLRAEEPGEEIARIRRVYSLLFGRPATPGEEAAAQGFLAEASWVEYAQVLLASNEFLYVD